MMPPTSTQHSWIAPDGETFPYSLWKTGGPLRAVIVAVHGLSGAALDYEPLGRHLAPIGCATYAMELRGQGNDPQPSRRGDLDKIETWFNDLHAFLELVRAQHPGVPLFFYGESMGAAILTRFLAQAITVDQPEGIILASPVVAIQQKPSWWMTLLFRVVFAIRPSHRIDVRKLATKGEDLKIVTRDEAHREWFKTAPHRVDVFTLRFFKCLFELIAGCFEAALKIRVSALVIYSQHDILIHTDLVEQFFQLLGSKDKEIELFPESYHLLLHDHDQKDVLDRVTCWLQNHLPPRPIFESLRDP